MNAAHLHLMVNHLPLFAVLFALVFLAIGLWRPLLPVVRRAGLVLLVVGGLGGGAAYLSGEPAEEIVEEQAQFDHDRVEEHEDAGMFGMISTAIAGLLALGILWRSRGKMVGGRATILALVVGLWAMAVLARTAWLGGKIQHPELRDGAAAIAPAPGDDHD